MLNRRKVTVFTQFEKVQEVMAAMQKAAYSAVPGDGMMAVLLVEQLIQSIVIWTRNE